MKVYPGVTVVADLVVAGHSLGDIVAKTGFSKSTVKQYRMIARKVGLLQPAKDEGGSIVFEELVRKMRRAQKVSAYGGGEYDDPGAEHHFQNDYDALRASLARASQFEREVMDAMADSGDMALNSAIIGYMTARQDAEAMRHSGMYAMYLRERMAAEKVLDSMLMEDCR